MTADLVAYSAGLSRCAGVVAARPLVAAPPTGVLSATLDEDAGVAVLHVAPGVLASAFERLGAVTEAPAVPTTTRGPLPVMLYPAAPGAVAVYGVPHVAAVTVRWPAAGPAGEPRLDPATGRLTVRRRTVGPATSRLAADALGGVWRDMQTGHAWLDVEDELPGGGGTWFASLGFDGDALGQVSLAYVAAGESRDWGSVTEETERLAQQRNEAWLAGQLGDGERGDRRWEKAFPWGSAWSAFVPRDGAVSMGVTYRR